ncbi:carbohydrate esterase family 4 protein [Backusella circina FSU 941]|nr:carbohydrate esterase family 4 protein [Backusella circina FSU 941]
MWNSKVLALSAAVLYISSAVNAQNTTTTTTANAPPPQTSPAWLSSVKPLTGNVQAYPSNSSSVPTGPLSNITFDISGYPEGWKTPDTNSTEVQAAYNSIDWSLVPSSTVHKANADGSVSVTGYDASDPDCWWSASLCVKSKNPVIPPDAYACPKAGDWGLTYDDGPLTADGGEWAEPNLYDFLAQHNQKAGLFYIGSNVIAAPAAAQRALADGHTICVHTWSHPAMTTVSNEGVVAELYWTLKAIKEVTGVTSKCWRPPYGDVDDRVRAIAWQMGLTTVLWDEDTNDWNMPGDGGGNLSPDTVDGYFEGWINARKNGTDNQTGHIILQHELNNATVSMAEKWLPQVQAAFRVVPWNQCYNVSQPYWETNFVYPTDNGTTTVPVASSASVAPKTSSVAATPAASAGTKGAADASSAASRITSSNVAAVAFGLAAAALAL